MPLELINLSFTELLLYGTPALAALFTYLLLRREDDKEIRINNANKILRYIHYLLLLALSTVTIYSVYAGFRPLIYFFVVSALFITSILIGLVSNKKDQSRILFLTALILAISVPTAVILGNHFYPYNSFGSEPILQTGNIEAYQTGAMESGLYRYIPIETLIEASVALVIGQTIIAPYIVTTFFMIAVVTGLFSLLRRLSHNSLAAIIGVFFCLSIPALSLFGRLWPLTYAVFYILFALLLYKSSRASVIGLWIVSLPMIFAHPSGFIAVIVVLLPLALLSIRNWPDRGQSSSKIRLPVVTLIVVAFAYLSYTYLISLMAKQGVKFYSSIYSYFSGVAPVEGVGIEYVPRYYSSGYEIFAYAWAVPVALSAALLISVIFHLLRKKKLDASQSFTLLSAFAGLLVVFFAYWSSRGETGQYLIPVGYLLILFSSSVVAAKLLSSRGKRCAAIVALLLTVFILVGTYSPNWAPLEHQDFETAAIIHPYRVYIEAGTVTSLIPANVTTWCDDDFPVGLSGKLPRDIISQISSGESPTRFARQPLTLFAIRNEHFSGGFVDLDLVYSNGHHVIVAITYNETR